EISIVTNSEGAMPAIRCDRDEPTAAQKAFAADQRCPVVVFKRAVCQASIRQKMCVAQTEIAGRLYTVEHHMNAVSRALRAAAAPIFRKERVIASAGLAHDRVCQMLPVRTPLQKG